MHATENSQMPLPLPQREIPTVSRDGVKSNTQDCIIFMLSNKNIELAAHTMSLKMMRVRWWMRQCEECGCV